MHNAWPTEVAGVDLRSEGDEVAAESVELAFETMEVKAAWCPRSQRVDGT